MEGIRMTSFAPEAHPAVRHKRTAGDVVFWDNHSTMHDATLDDGDAPRVMHGVSLQGDRPV